MLLSAIVVYLVVLASAGVWLGRRAQTGDDFLVAGRTLPARVLACTLLSAWIGSGSLFAGAGLAYRSGFSALWPSAGAWAGIVLVYLIAPRVRRSAQYTVPDLLELRYGPAARLLGTVTIVVAYTTIAAYQFRGGGRLLNLVSGIDPTAGALVTALVCVAGTALGGMRTVAYLDIGNAVMMLTGVGVAIVYLSGHAGGFGPALAALRPEHTTLFGRMSPAEALGLFLPTLCLLVGEASMYQKLSSARDERAARRSVAGWLAGTMALQVLMVGVAALGSAALPGLTTAQSETIVVRVAVDLLPPVFGMLLLAGAAAMVVATANSFLLTPATNLAHDVYQRFIDPGVTDRALVNGTRALVVLLAAIAFVIGTVLPAVLSTTIWAYTMYGAGITPALLAALLWPRATRRAGLASIAAGMVATLVWEVIALERGGYPLGLQAIYPALVLSIGTLAAGTVRAQGDIAD